ncbi:MAG: alpha/beta hydrolase [Haloferacaceae archaeon]
MADRAPELHPQARALVDRLDVPPSHALTPRGARRASKSLFASLDADVETPIDAADLSIPGPDGELRVRTYTPAGDGPFPVFVYLHGGGWVRSGLDTHDAVCRTFADRVGCAVVAVDYRRAPEHPFPAAAVDCYAATEWVAEFATVFGGDPGRVAVGGDSAGGNLAAVVAQMARDRDGPTLARQVLVYPVVDHAFDTPSYAENADAPILTRRSMEWYWEQYLEHDFDGMHPYASPIRATDLSNLPPATVITAGYDPLRDEGEAYAEALADAGVDVNYTNYADVPHVFVQFDELDRAREAQAEIAADLRDSFGIR